MIVRNDEPAEVTDLTEYRRHPYTIPEAAWRVVRQGGVVVGGLWAVLVERLSAPKGD